MIDSNEFEFFSFDPTIASTNLRCILGTLGRHGVERTWTQGREFILSLSDQILCDYNIALSVSSFYWDHGHCSKAKWALKNTGINIQSLDDEQLLNDTQLACVYLQLVYVAIHCDCSFEQALDAVMRVDGLYWPEERVKDCGQVPPLHSRTGSTLLLRRNALWSSDDPAEFDDSTAPVTNHRIYLEGLIILLYEVLAHAGYVPLELFDTKVKARVPPMIKYLRARGRRYEEISLVFGFGHPESSIHESSADASLFWQEYITSLSPSHPPLLKSHALLHMAELQLPDKEKASTYVGKAMQLLDHENNESSVAIINAWRVQNLQSKSHSKVTRLDQIETIILSVRTTGDIATYRSCASQAMRMVRKEPLLWPRITNLVNDLETNLKSAGDLYGIYLTSFQYHNYLVNMLPLAEEGRRLFEAYVAHPPKEIGPDLFAMACKIACKANVTLQQYPRALEFAEMEYSSPMSHLSKYRKSEAASRVAECKEHLLKAKLEALGEQPIPVSQENQIIREGHELADFIEGWIRSDQDCRFRSQKSGKVSTLTSVYHLLASQFHRQEDVEKWRFWLKPLRDVSSEPKLTLKGSPTLSRVMNLLMDQNKPAEAMAIAKKWVEATAQDSTTSDWDLAKARLFFVATLQGAFIKVEEEHLKRLPFDARSRSIMLEQPYVKDLRAMQYKMLSEDLKVPSVPQHAALMVARARLMTGVAKDCISIWPERRAEFLHVMGAYFNQTEQIVQRIRRDLQHESGLQTWLMKRNLRSSWLFYEMVNSAEEFYLCVGESMRAWYWIQRARGQSLLDMLSDRDSSAMRLCLAFQNDQNDKNLRYLLAREEELTGRLAKSGVLGYKSAKVELEQHRLKMRENPALQQLFSLGDDKPLHIKDLDDVWELARYLHEGQDLILVDWVVTPEAGIWRVTVNYKDRNMKPLCQPLEITRSYVQSWISVNMQFPMGEPAELEKNPKTLWKLRALTDGLEKISKPGDLFVLNLARELSGLPIHALRLDGQPGLILIKRNPVIYSSSISLFQQCLRRAQLSHGRELSPLRNACFTAAYEEEGHDAERKRIFQVMNQTADKFGAATCLGKDLTSGKLRDALVNSAWVHYHGHAFFSKTEALDQAFVLSGLREEEKMEQTRMISIAKEEGREELLAAYGKRAVPSGEYDHHTSVNDTKQHKPLLSASVENDLEHILQVEQLSSKDDNSNAQPKPNDFKNDFLKERLLDNSSRVSVADIFALDLSKTHPVVCSIACDSGVQDISPGDEPLGLVSALFCAGASSVVGTLWPIRSATGRVFTTAFYQDLEKQKEAQILKETSDGQRLLNLADAMRYATLKVMDQKKDPYSWAAFTLQGAGFLFY